MTIHVYFNVHFSSGQGTVRTSLFPLNGLEDIVKVFFNKEDFGFWKEVAPSSNEDQAVIDKFYENANISYSLGQYHRGFLYIFFIKAFQRDEEGMPRMLRMKETPLILILEATDMCGALLEFASSGLKSHRKFNLELAIFSMERLREFCESITYLERNIFLESLQPSILRVLQVTENVLKEHGLNKLERVISNLIWIRDALKVQNKLASVSLYEILRENSSYSS